MSHSLIPVRWYEWVCECVGCVLGSDSRSRDRYNAVRVGQRLPATTMRWRRLQAFSHWTRSLSTLRHHTVWRRAHCYRRHQLT